MNNVSENTIITQNLTLHAITEADNDNMIDLLMSDKINKSYLLPDYESREAAQKMAERFIEMCKSKDRFVYGIYLNDTLIGWINDCGIENGSIELGYVISPKHWNNGYATQALTASIEELKKRGYEKVICGHFEDNPASGRVMQKSGMHRIDRAEEIEYRGKVHKILYYEV